MDHKFAFIAKLARRELYDITRLVLACLVFGCSVVCLFLRLSPPPPPRVFGHTRIWGQIWGILPIFTKIPEFSAFWMNNCRFFGCFEFLFSF